MLRRMFELLINRHPWKMTALSKSNCKQFLRQIFNIFVNCAKYNDKSKDKKLNGYIIDSSDTRHKDCTFHH